MIAGIFLGDGLTAADGLLGGLVAAALGLALGRLLSRGVGGLLDAGVFADDGKPIRAEGEGDAGRRWILSAFVGAAVGLWWWEVYARGLGPDGTTVATSAAGGMAEMARCAAHIVLAFLLAAAAWIDIRHRVIPDLVTVPGVILGLTAVWLEPGVLLPIASEVPRSFAAPLVSADVLAWHGGLLDPLPDPAIDGLPNLPGLALSLALFFVWWLVCTAPFSVWPQDARSSAHRSVREGLHAVGGRLREPRTLLLVVGIGAVVAAWWAGGTRFRAMESSLIGMAVSGGLVWAVREGASRALGREAMGLGDVTLMAMVGAWVGWQAGVLAFFLAAFIGLAHGLVQLARHHENELPYGPSLCLASGLVILAWKYLWRWAGETLSQPLLLAGVLSAVVVMTAVTLFVWRRIRARDPAD